MRIQLFTVSVNYKQQYVLAAVMQHAVIYCFCRYSDGQLTLTYRNGSSCHSGFHRETVILLHCNVSAGTCYCDFPLPSARQHPSYGDCLEVKSEYYQNCSVLGCVTQCSQSAAHLYEQFLQVQQIGFVTLGILRRA